MEWRTAARIMTRPRAIPWPPFSPQRAGPPGENALAASARPHIIVYSVSPANPMHTLRHLRFAFIALVAVLCLLGVQQGAAFHGLSHRADENSSEPQKQLPHAKSCDKCVVYAEVSGAGPTTAHPSLQVPAQSVALASVARQLFFSPTLPAYSARAPPLSI